MAYVYRHIRKDKNEVFYIGIGTDDKGKYVRAKSKNRNRYWKRIVDKTIYEIEILFDNISKEEAIKKEIEFIQLYGRRDQNNGTLCNLTDGGEGAVNMSEEGKSVLRELAKKRVVPEERKKMFSKIFKGSGNPNSSKVINRITLEVFGSIMEAAEKYGISRHTLRDNLNGKSCNHSDFFYYKDYLEKGIEVLEKERIEKIKFVQEKLKNERKNRIVSEETKRKISESGKGRKPSEKAIMALVERNKGSNNHISKKVINTETNEVFYTITDAAKSIGKDRVWLSGKLNGKHKNKTNFMFLTDYNKKGGK